MIALLLLATRAFAQDVELFAPHTDVYDYGQTHGAATLGNLQVGAGAWVSYANDPLVLVDAAGNRVSPTSGADGDQGDALVDSRLTAHAQVGMGFTRFASLTVNVPFVLSQAAWNEAQLGNLGGARALDSAALGDLVIAPKFAVLDPSESAVGIALVVPVGVPTGPGTDYIGAGGVTARPNLVIEKANGNVHTRRYTLRGAVNLGYDVVPSTRIHDARLGGGFAWAAAAGWHPASAIELTMEAHGRAGGTAASSPAEALIGAQTYLGKWALLRVAGGAGILGGVGAPDYRVVAGFAVAPSLDPAGRDSDDDGMSDGRDRCPNDSEDVDNFEDADGCPDRDNDADGREDGADQCPNDPEDDDGYMDNDGCPDPDNDKDGVTDMSDRCPDQAETMNGNEDEDGCPDDQPSADSDGDSFADNIDRCPYDPEDLNQFEDDDGCPDERLKNARVVISGSSIKIKDVINFDPGKSIILASSYALVDEIALVISQHPELKKIRVEGHTDNKGDPLKNLKLSQSRAEAVVKYLAGKGIAADRLDAAGFGEMRPIADNKTEDGRAQNRRVEFIIVDRD